MQTVEHLLAAAAALCLDDLTGRARRPGAADRRWVVPAVPDGAPGGRGGRSGGGSRGLPGHGAL